MDAYSKGYAAGVKGQPISDNPFHDASQQSAEWFEGFHDGRADRQRVALY